MQRMKREHEDKFSSVIQKMRNSVIDYGTVNQYSKVIKIMSWEGEVYEDMWTPIQMKMEIKNERAFQMESPLL